MLCSCQFSRGMIKCDHLERSVPVNKELRENIPVISFLMMIEVIQYHCESPDPSLAVSALDMKLSNIVTDFVNGVPCGLCMSWFFSITAFLLFRNLSFQNLGSKLKARVKTLLVPYILWQIIYLVKSILQGNSWTVADAFGQIFLLRLWPPLGAFWYVYAVFLLSLLSPILLILFQNKKIGWFAAATLILLLYFCWDLLYIGNGRGHYTGNIKMHFPAYVIGAYCGNVYDDKQKDSVLRPVAGFLLVGALFNIYIPNFLHNMSISVLPMLILFLIPMPESWKNRSVYRCAFLMYATHQSIISVSISRIWQVLYTAFHSVFAANLFGRILCLLLIIAVNMGIHALMSRYTPRTLRVLTGGRC